jgi:uncharacterized membrane protein YraQ (UPF0718 family)/copper chaperone CopZ
MLQSYLHEVWQVMLDLSPSLLLGLFIAGLMHVYLPKGFVHRGLNRPDWRSVTRASLIGVPLPLCSCGVIPTALGLRNEGASKGATTAFMISTPQTGVDSILVSASFLGWPFAIFKLAAAFVTGLIGGALVNRLTGREAPEPAPDRAAGADEARGRGGMPGALRYALFDLLAAIDLWIIAGVLAAALITTFIPPDYLAGQTWTQGLGGMLLVLAISIPLYVCTTGSVPIAASLIAAGMPAGTALVFLMAGPSTNVATIGAVYRTLGAKVLAAYLGTVVVMSVLLGLAFDQVLEAAPVTAPVHEHGIDWIALGSALLLALLLAFLLARRARARWGAIPQEGDGLTLVVEGMSCQHCVASVKRSLEGLEAVEAADPNLSTGLVRVRGEHLDATALIAAVERAGYRAKRAVDGAGEIN